MKRNSFSTIVVWCCLLNLVNAINSNQTCTFNINNPVIICQGDSYQLPSGISVSIAGNYTDTIVTQNNCDSIIHTTLSVNSLSNEATSIAANAITICYGASTILSVNGGSLGTGASWNWYENSCIGAMVGTGSNITVSPSATTTYYIRAEGTCNTTACNSITITVGNISAAWTSPESICENTVIDLNDYVSGTSGGTWSGTGVSGHLFSPTGLSGQSVMVTYSISSGSCSDVSSQMIAIKSSPDASWQSPPPICSNQVDIDLTSYYTGSTTISGTWYGAGVSGNMFDPSGLGGQTVIVSYAVGDNGCRDSIAKNITIVSGVSAAWTSPGSICENAGAIDLNNYVVGTLGGIWSGTGVTGGTFYPGGLGSYVNLTYSIANGSCLDFMVHSINIKVAPHSIWAVPALICENQGLIDLTNLLDTIATTGGTWSGMGVTGNNFNPVGLSSQDPSITYTVSLNGCVDSTTQSMPVDVCTGIASKSTTKQVVMYPNPTNGLVQLANVPTGSIATVYNMLGEVVITAELFNSTAVIDLTGYTNGIYYVRINNNNTVIFDQKVVKQ